jgi:hypothetical protein
MCMHQYVCVCELASSPAPPPSPFSPVSLSLPRLLDRARARALCKYFVSEPWDDIKPQRESFEQQVAESVFVVVLLYWVCCSLVVVLL